MSRERVLIATIPPYAGGVRAMLDTAVRLFAERGIDTDLAWYEPYSRSPRLSVPLHRLGTAWVASEARAVPFGASGLAVGALLPELEVTHYRATRPWRDAIAECRHHWVVSGTALAGRAFLDAKIPFVAWLASDWEGDRRDRVRRFPPMRRMLDRTIVSPLGRRLERRILLGASQVIALSEATRRALDRVAGRAVARAVMPVPIDVERIRPDPERVVPGRVGFLGRFDDPRKNFPLFLDAIREARTRERSITAMVFGAQPRAEDRAAVSARGLDGAVEFAGELPRAEYEKALATLDVVCVTSHQEGLHVAALEAMAAGCPIVSTRCGGPEEFVEDGVNGMLTGFDAEEIGSALLRFGLKPLQRIRYSQAAREAVLSGFAVDGVQATFRQAFASRVRP